MRDQYMRHGQGFLLVYSITSRNSFNDILRFREQVLRVKDAAKVPMILIGNKCDLQGDREVSTSEGMDLAKSFDCPFLESSAFLRINVDECFFDLVREIRKAQNPDPKKRKEKKA